jgi:formiminoglutamase
MSFDSSFIQNIVTHIDLHVLSNDELYHKKEMGSNIQIHTQTFFPEVEHADIIIIGVNDLRGQGTYENHTPAITIRKALYKLYYWHNDVTIADIGDIITGKTLTDTYAAITTVLKELIPLQKKVVIIGGSNDMVYGQYNAYSQLNQIVEITGIDALIDIDENQLHPASKFLFDVLTEEPNFCKHYNHLGFQSYFVNPDLLQTIDKLKFDCFRVGKLKEHMDEAEPLMRNSSIIYFDVNAIAHAYAPANGTSPNGFTGEEACMLSRFAAMTHKAGTFGIYGYQTTQDTNNITAIQIAQMIWYYIDGVHQQKTEAPLDDLIQYNQYNLSLAEVNTTFLQSKKSGRWWMQMPDGKYIPCALSDYITASKNEIPERWYRVQERDV